MYTPSMKRSAPALYLGPGVYLHTRLDAEEETKELAEKFLQDQNLLKQRQSAYEEAQVRKTVARAYLDAKRIRLVEGVRRFSHLALSETRYRRSARQYQIYFPEGLTGVFRGPRGKRMEKIQRILAKLQKEENAALLEAGQPLVQLYQEVEEAEAAYRQAVTDLTEVHALLRRQKLLWAKAYKRTYASLILVFDDDPNKAEDFFEPNPRRKSEEPEEIPEKVTTETGQVSTGTDGPVETPGPELVSQTST